MKKLSDYQGNEAIELWADIIEDAGTILADTRIKWLQQKGATISQLAAYILREHSEETAKILLRIDPTPLTALNALTRLMVVITEIEGDAELRDFFGLQGQMTINESSGSATVNIVGAEN